jgi:hypothetical protein
VNKDEQSVDDVLDPLVLYWDKDENKQAIDDEIRRFYNSHKDRLKKVLTARVNDGIDKMIADGKTELEAVEAAKVRVARILG